MQTLKTYLTIEEVADYLNISTGTLYQWRHRGFGPVAHKFGGAVRYSQSDVDEWIASNRDGSPDARQ